MGAARERWDATVGWPWWVRLIDRLVGTVLEEGWVSEEWIEDVIAEAGRERGTRRWMQAKGVRADGPGGPGDGDWRGRLVAHLVAPEGRREICEGLALEASLGTAAAAALRRIDVEALPEILADAISEGEAKVTGALAVLGRIGDGDEVRTFASTERLFDALSERGVAVWGGEETGEEADGER